MTGPRETERELWARAGRVAAATQRALAAAGDDRLAWAAAASRGASALAGLAAQLEPDGRGQLSEAAVSLADAAQGPRTAGGRGKLRRRIRPQDPIQVAGVTVLAGRGGPIGMVTLLLQAGATIRAFAAARRRTRTRKRSH